MISIAHNYEDRRLRLAQANVPLDNLHDIHLTFEVLTGLDISGSEAVLTVTQIDSISQGGAFVPHTSKMVVKLKRRDSDQNTSGWYIESIR